MNKKGLSTVVTSLIIIVLSLVAIGIVWVVVKNSLEQSGENVEAGSSNVILTIVDSSVKVNPGTPSVLTFRIKREIGEGQLSGVKIIMSDGQDTTNVEKEISMSPLDEKTFDIEVTGLPYVKELSVAPIIKTESGKELQRGVTDKYDFTLKQKMSFFNGLVSWWRFEGDASDTWGSNEGTIGSTTEFEDGKFGEAASFDGTESSVISLGNSEELNPSDEMSIEAWIYFEGLISSTETSDVILERFTPSNVKRAYWFGVQDNIGADNSPKGFVFSIKSSDTCTTTQQCTARKTSQYGLVKKNKWIHLVGTYSSEIGDDGTSKINLYVNGEKDEGADFIYNLNSDNTKIVQTTESNNIAGSVDSSNQYFNGKIDELRFYNKELTEEQVKALYEMELD